MVEQEAKRIVISSWRRGHNVVNKKLVRGMGCESL